ncbi:MAG: hypothetical protein NPINA01_27880 [Nitrospinaceae bacterium]|nr:MAG: hypothetical protein NPINA01_27880 [Nitrospinaceae bacterium]
MVQTPDKPKSKIRLLVLSHETLPFIKQDELILKKHFTTNVYSLSSYDTIPTALKNYGNVILWLIKNIRHYDGLFLTFADVYGFFLSIFARLFKKKLFVRVGGFDAAWIPELKYGTYHNKRSRFFSWFTYKTASKILPVSKTLVHDTGNHLGLNIPEQGIKVFYPDVDPEKIIVIPNGYESSTFKPNAKKKRTDTILMVGNIKNHQTFKIKGVDIYLNLARATPELNFTLVGANSQLLQQWIELPSNLTVIPHVSHNELPQYYQMAKVYMCLSISEGMPNVLSEAMLSGCVPMGFKISCIPEIIGSTGVVLDSLNIDKIKSGLFQALKMDGEKAREQIKTHYPLEAREKRLVQIIESEFLSEKA